jgi:hypothetical protein
MTGNALQRCLLTGEDFDVPAQVSGAAGVAGYPAAVGPAHDGW